MSERMYCGGRRQGQRLRYREIYTMSVEFEGRIEAPPTREKGSGAGGQ